MDVEETKRQCDDHLISLKTEIQNEESFIESVQQLQLQIRSLESEVSDAINDQRLHEVVNNEIPILRARILQLKAKGNESGKQRHYVEHNTEPAIRALLALNVLKQNGIIKLKLAVAKQDGKRLSKLELARLRFEVHNEQQLADLENQLQQLTVDDETRKTLTAQLQEISTESKQYEAALSRSPDTTVQQYDEIDDNWKAAGQDEDEIDRQLDQVEELSHDLRQRTISLLPSRLEDKKAQISQIPFEDRKKINEKVDTELLSSTSPSYEKSSAADFNVSISEVQCTNIFLGGGGFGMVFKGVYRGETVALKRLLSQTDEIRDEMKNIATLVKLKHKNLLAIFGFYMDECSEGIGCPTIIMEYCCNGSLRRWINGSERIAKGYFVKWMQQIAAAMFYLHNCHIAHRDLKPENVLLDESLSVRICDFGLCRELNKTIDTISFCGTDEYMAPEIISRQPCSVKVDVWSFGVLFWETLTQSRPYGKANNCRILFKIGNRRIDPNSSHSFRLEPPVQCPAESAAIINDCLRVDANSRPSFGDIKHRMPSVEVANCPTF
ncbi:unnamed protein product [Toxocara canis]|uniref:Protein kinase domain-containing protein n=1 Tax=Toxocara canis TaxID=6265 RepID=A0A183UL68_TOXCA|nr:unnamed protein product [Toxocara canis]